MHRLDVKLMQLGELFDVLGHHALARVVVGCIRKLVCACDFFHEDDAEVLVETKEPWDFQASIL